MISSAMTIGICKIDLHVVEFPNVINRKSFLSYELVFQNDDYD